MRKAWSDLALLMRIRLRQWRRSTELMVQLYTMGNFILLVGKPRGNNVLDNMFAQFKKSDHILERQPVIHHQVPIETVRSRWGMFSVRCFSSYLIGIIITKFFNYVLVYLCNTKIYVDCIGLWDLLFAVGQSDNRSGRVSRLP